MRRLLTAHKPLLRLARRRARRAEQRRFQAEALAVDRELAQVAAGSGPIVAGPWLAEVGYEALYWIPLLRWFTDRYGISRDRLIVVSRGGVESWYADVAATYVDLFDLMTPEQLAARNRQRQVEEERGGQKQSAAGAFDREIVEAVAARVGRRPGSVCHPSLLFRLFRHVWYGNLPLDFFWTRTRYRRLQPTATVVSAALPQELPAQFVTAKFYSGTALPLTDANRASIRALISRLALRLPVISLDSDIGVDEHRDFDLAGIPNVISARGWMTPASNLGVQSALIARSQAFVGTCGGLAWLAPFLGVPTSAVFADDQLLGVHLMIARQAMRASGAAEFATLDLRAARRIGVDV